MREGEETETRREGAPQRSTGNTPGRDTDVRREGAEAGHQCGGGLALTVPLSSASVSSSPVLVVGLPSPSQPCTLACTPQCSGRRRPCHPLASPLALSSRQGCARRACGGEGGGPASTRQRGRPLRGGREGSSVGGSPSRVRCPPQRADRCAGQQKRQQRGERRKAQQAAHAREDEDRRGRNHEHVSKCPHTPHWHSTAMQHDGKRRKRRGSAESESGSSACACQGVPARLHPLGSACGAPHAHAREGSEQQTESCRRRAGASIRSPRSLPLAR